jgi:hypothetical protein
MPAGVYITNICIFCCCNKYYIRLVLATFYSIMCSLVWQCTDCVSWSVVLSLGVLTCGGNGGRWIGTCLGIRWGCVNDNQYKHET